MRILHQIAPFFLACFALPATALTDIRIHSMVGHEIEENGTLRIHVDVSNGGSETAFAASSTLFLDENMQRVSLGNITPGRKFSFDYVYKKPELTVGTHIAVIGISFEEPGGRRHRLFNFTSIDNRPGGSSIRAPSVSMDATSPVFYRKTFWGKSSPIVVALKNQDPAGMNVRLVVFYPTGFAIHPLVQQVSLLPGEEKQILFESKIESAERSAEYLLVADMEKDGVHGATIVKGTLRVQDPHVYFKIYLAAAILGAIVFGLWAFRRKTGIKAAGGRQ